MSQAMLFERGSAAIADWYLDALAKTKGISIIGWKDGVDPNLEAILSPKEEFIKNFTNLGQIESIALNGLTEQFKETPFTSTSAQTYIKAFEEALSVGLSITDKQTELYYKAINTLNFDDAKNLLPKHLTDEEIRIMQSQIKEQNSVEGIQANLGEAVKNYVAESIFDDPSQLVNLTPSQNIADTSSHFLELVKSLEKYINETEKILGTLGLSDISKQLSIKALERFNTIFMHTYKRNRDEKIHEEIYKIINEDFFTLRVVIEALKKGDSLTALNTLALWLNSDNTQSENINSINNTPQNLSNNTEAGFIILSGFNPKVPPLVKALLKKPVFGTENPNGEYFPNFPTFKNWLDSMGLTQNKQQEIKPPIQVTAEKVFISIGEDMVSRFPQLKEFKNIEFVSDTAEIVNKNGMYEIVLKIKDGENIQSVHFSKEKFWEFAEYIAIIAGLKQNLHLPDNTDNYSYPVKNNLGVSIKQLPFKDNSLYISDIPAEKYSNKQNFKSFIEQVVSELYKQELQSNKQVILPKIPNIYLEIPFEFQNIVYSLKADKIPEGSFEQKEVFIIKTESFIEKFFDSKIKSQETIDVEERDEKLLLEQERVKQIVESKFAEIESQKASNTINNFNERYQELNNLYPNGELATILVGYLNATQHTQINEFLNQTNEDKIYCEYISKNANSPLNLAFKIDYKGDIVMHLSDYIMEIFRCRNNLYYNDSRHLGGSSNRIEDLQSFFECNPNIFEGFYESALQAKTTSILKINDGQQIPLIRNEINITKDQIIQFPLKQTDNQVKQVEGKIISYLRGFFEVETNDGKVHKVVAENLLKYNPDILPIGTVVTNKGLKALYAGYIKDENGKVKSFKVFDNIANKIGETEYKEFLKENKYLLRSEDFVLNNLHLIPNNIFVHYEIGQEGLIQGVSDDQTYFIIKNSVSNQLEKVLAEEIIRMNIGVFRGIPPAKITKLGEGKLMYGDSNISATKYFINGITVVLPNNPSKVGIINKLVNLGKNKDEFANNHLVVNHQRVLNKLSLWLLGLPEHWIRSVKTIEIYPFKKLDTAAHSSGETIRFFDGEENFNWAVFNHEITHSLIKKENKDTNPDINHATWTEIATTLNGKKTYYLSSDGAQNLIQQTNFRESDIEIINSLISRQTQNETLLVDLVHGLKELKQNNIDLNKIMFFSVYDSGGNLLKILYHLPDETNKNKVEDILEKYNSFADITVLNRSSVPREDYLLAQIKDNTQATEYGESVAVGVEDIPEFSSEAYFRYLMQKFPAPKSRQEKVNKVILQIEELNAQLIELHAKHEYLNGIDREERTSEQRDEYYIYRVEIMNLVKRKEKIVQSFLPKLFSPLTIGKLPMSLSHLDFGLSSPVYDSFHVLKEKINNWSDVGKVYPNRVKAFNETYISNQKIEVTLPKHFGERYGFSGGHSYTINSIAKIGSMPNGEKAIIVTTNEGEVELTQEEFDNLNIAIRKSLEKEIKIIDR